MLSLTEGQVEQIQVAAGHLAASMELISDRVSAILSTFASDLQHYYETTGLEAIRRINRAFEKAQARQNSNDPRIRSGLDEWLRISDKVAMLLKEGKEGSREEK